MLRRARNFAIPLLTALLAVGFALPARAATVLVQMTSVNFTPTFIPNEITIRPGDTVRWVNVDPLLLDHATCNGTGSADPAAGTVWTSGTMRTGDFYEHTFDLAGDFAYFSIPHEFAGMFGTVHVASSLPVPTIETSTWGKVKMLFRETLPRD